MTLCRILESKCSWFREKPNALVTLLPHPVSHETSYLTAFIMRTLVLKSLNKPSSKRDIYREKITDLHTFIRAVYRVR